MKLTLGVGEKGIADGLALSGGEKTVATYWCRTWFGGEAEKRKQARNFRNAHLAWPTD
jgi:hypothetical protein